MIAMLLFVVLLKALAVMHRQLLELHVKLVMSWGDKAQQRAHLVQSLGLDKGAEEEAAEEAEEEAAGGGFGTSFAERRLCAWFWFRGAVTALGGTLRGSVESSESQPPADGGNSSGPADSSGSWPSVGNETSDSASSMHSAEAFSAPPENLRAELESESGHPSCQPACQPASRLGERCSTSALLKGGDDESSGESASSSSSTSSPRTDVEEGEAGDKTRLMPFLGHQPFWKHPVCTPSITTRGSRHSLRNLALVDCRC